MNGALSSASETRAPRLVISTAVKTSAAAASGAIFCDRKATLIEIRQLGLTAACKALHSQNWGDNLLIARKVDPRLPQAPSDQGATGGGNPVALSRASYCRNIHACV